MQGSRTGIEFLETLKVIDEGAVSIVGSRIRLKDS
jgi:hypothetical protein